MLFLTCGQCGTNNPQDAIFCKKCGQRLAESQPDITEATEKSPSQQTEQTIKPPEKSTSKTPIVVVLLIIGLVAVYFIWDVASTSVESQPTACSIVARSYIADVENIIERWDDANSLASSTSRIALNGPVGQLQAIRRDTNGLEPPACARDAQRLLILYMDAVIRGYIAFMSQQDEDEVNRIFDSASVALSSWIIEYSKVKQGY